MSAYSPIFRSPIAPPGLLGLSQQDLAARKRKNQIGTVGDTLTSLGIGLMGQGPTTTPQGPLQGLSQGLGLSQQMAQQRQAQQSDQQRTDMAQAQFGMQQQAFQADQAKDQREQMLAEAQAKDREEAIKALPPEYQKFAHDPEFWQSYYKEKLLHNDGGPQSSIAKANADLKAGRMSQADYDAFVRKETYIAPREGPQDPETIRLLRAAGIDPKSPEGQQAIRSKLGNGGGPFEGTGLDAQDSNIILQGQTDPAVRATPQYAMAWNRQYQQPRIITTSDPKDPSRMIQQQLMPKIPDGLMPPEGGAAVPPGAPGPTATPIAGTETVKPKTNEQTQAEAYSNRMSNSNGIIGKFSEAGTSWKQSAFSSVPVLGNVLVSGERQQLEQAERDFVNALLRRESGAAISSGEFASAKQQYFPQPGDSEAVVKQKAKNREIAIQGVQGAANPYPAATTEPPAIPPPPPGFQVVKP